MRISDWSSDVCSSDLARSNLQDADARDLWVYGTRSIAAQAATLANLEAGTLRMRTLEGPVAASLDGADTRLLNTVAKARKARSEEHTSELQSLMRISYAVFCLKKKKSKYEQDTERNTTRQNRTIGIYSR